MRPAHPDNMPADRPPGNPPPRRFRMKRWPLMAVAWGWMVAAGVVAVAALYAVFAAAGSPTPLWVLAAAYAAGLTGGLIASALVFAWFAWRFPVLVRPAGLWGQGVWGQPVAVPWEAPVTRLRPLSLLGLPYLLLSADGVPGTLWLPLFLADLRGFADAVAECAGGDHPLAEAVRERLADG